MSLVDVEEVVVGRGSSGMGEGGAKRVTWSFRDELMSRNHARVRRERSGWVLADLDSKNGTFIAGKRIGEEHLRDGDLFRIGSSIFKFHYAPVRLAERSSAVAFHSANHVRAFDTLSSELAEKWREADKLARTKLPLLIVGETGVGKEIAARELHERSDCPGDFVAVNCGALPESLVASELFGHVRGAFSGADRDRSGLVQRANGGTLFLDEIAELSTASQVALLRVIQQGEVRPVGSTDPVSVDVRFIAATHRDLEAEVAAGNFREDLLARLSGHQIDIPPLRERREDLGLLVARMIADGSLEELRDRRFSPRAIGTLLGYDFPRNVRELVHILQRASALAEGGLIKTRHLPESLFDASTPKSEVSSEDDDLEARLIATLEETGGNVAKTARQFGKAPIQVRRWCRRFGIDLADFRAK